jgi:hypothetical protein
MNFAIDTFPPERFGRISGSRCSPLVPIKDAQKGMITLAKELAGERYWQTYDEVSTWEIEHGKMAEHFANEHYKEHYNSNVQKGQFGFDGELSWSTDAETDEYGIDYKCPTSRKGYERYLFDGLKKEEIDQCQFYMMVRNKPKWLIAAYLCETQRMSDNGLTYPITQDHRMIIIEVDKDLSWREKFWSNHDFVIEQRDIYIEMLKLKFPK